MDHSIASVHTVKWEKKGVFCEKETTFYCLFEVLWYLLVIMYYSKYSEYIYWNNEWVQNACELLDFWTIQKMNCMYLQAYVQYTYIYIIHNIEFVHK